MTPAELLQRVEQLARDHPGAHPYTLSLLLQVETGAIRTGLQIKRLLHPPPPR